VLSSLDCVRPDSCNRDGTYDDMVMKMPSLIAALTSAVDWAISIAE